MDDLSSATAVRRLYDQIADVYDDRYGDDVSDVPTVERWLSSCGHDDVVLDVGCGPGTFIPHIRATGRSVVGVDLSLEMLQRAALRAPDSALACMDVRAMCFRDSAFDATLAAYSLIHVPDSEVRSVLREVARVVRSGGALLVIVQVGAPDHAEDDPLAPGTQVFVNFFDGDRMRAHLDASGFDVEWIETHTTDDVESMSGGVVYAAARRR